MGLAPDGALFMPNEIPRLGNDFISELQNLTLTELANHVLQPYLAASVPGETIQHIVNQTFTFPIPLKPIEDGIFSLELFHGPTQSFKDVGARFLSRLLGHFNILANRKLLVLTATSGDTGGAVANGFHKVPGVGVVILYPKGKISPYQEYQITSPGDNVMAIAVEGSFDDCQRLVKEAFNDAALREKIFMTSANSINIGRLLPQMVYYFHAVAQFRKNSNNKMPVITVPSGNFGNITAGMLAVRMGLPVARFIAATNANDVVPRYLKSGLYQPKPTIATLANAMDVGDPSNFSRVLEIHENDLRKLNSNLVSLSITDNKIKSTIKKVYDDTGYLMDPHTASAHAAFSERRREGEPGIILATAHPLKFKDTYDEILPGVLDKIGFKFDVEKVVHDENNVMPPVYNEFKSRLENMA